MCQAGTLVALGLRPRLLGAPVELTGFWVPSNLKVAGRITHQLTAMLTTRIAQEHCCSWHGHCSRASSATVRNCSRDTSSSHCRCAHRTTVSCCNTAQMLGCCQMPVITHSGALSGKEQPLFGKGQERHGAGCVCGLLSQSATELCRKVGKLHSTCQLTSTALSSAGPCLLALLPQPSGQSSLAIWS